MTTWITARVLVRFPSLTGGTSYEIDLSEKNQAALDKALASDAAGALSSAAAQRSDGAARYADRNRIGSCRDAATCAGSASRAATCSAT